MNNWMNKKNYELKINDQESKWNCEVIIIIG